MDSALARRPHPVKPRHALQPDTRIAVVEPDHGRLLSAVRALPVRCQVRRFSDVGADMTQLLQFRPEVLLFAVQPGDDDLAGTIRVARSALGGPPVVLVTDAEHEAGALALAHRTGSRVLIEPEKAGALAAALERTLAGADPNRHAAFLDIARGLADELNNPLMYVSGHLQLLARSLQGDQRTDQLQAAQDGVLRIRDTVDRLRLLVEAETGTPVPADLGQWLTAALTHAPGVQPPTVAGPVIAPAVPALEAALAALTRWLQALVDNGCHAALSLHGPPRPTLSVELQGALIDTWDVPRSFSPYSLGRGLAGGPHGLTLFLLHTAVHASGAMAIARRRPGSGMVLELLWP